VNDTISWLVIGAVGIMTGYLVWLAIKDSRR